MLYNDCRSNICIEHATGVMEEEKAPENLSKKISSISLTGNDKKVCSANLAFPWLGSIWKLNGFEVLAQFIFWPMFS